MKYIFSSSHLMINGSYGDFGKSCSKDTGTFPE